MFFSGWVRSKLTAKTERIGSEKLFDKALKGRHKKACGIATGVDARLFIKA
jgi:hypothetical protein